MDKQQIELYSKIDRFLNNEMTETEKQDFKKQIRANPQLQAEVSLHKALLKTPLLDDPHTQDFMAMNRKIHEAAQQQKAQVSPKGNEQSDAGERGGRSGFKIVSMVLAVAAAIAVLLLFVPGLFGPKTTETSLAALYEQYHPAKEIALVSSRGAAQELLNTIYEYFKNKQYTEALTASNTYLQAKEQEEYYQVLLVKGVSELELGKYDAAIATFSRYENSGIKSAIKGTWFKALAYLRMEDVENCKKNLEIVIKDGRYKLKEAKMLLEKL